MRFLPLVLLLLTIAYYVWQYQPEKIDTEMTTSIALPPLPPLPPLPSSPATLIVYSGPTAGGCSGKNASYHRNFRFFLDHALPCSYHNNLQVHVHVVLVLVEHAVTLYNDRLAELEASGCVRVIFRPDDACYDMRSYELALTVVDAARYDKFVFLNCGLIGPLLPATSLENPHHWSRLFTDILDDNTKLVGLTVNCGGKNGVKIAHVQSMLWATDAVGLAVVQEAGVFFNCTHTSRDELIVRYELGLSKAMWDANLSIQAINTWQRGYRFYHNHPVSEICTDQWYLKQLRTSPLDTVFFKTTRPGLDKFKAVDLHVTNQDQYRSRTHRARHNETPRVCARASQGDPLN